jgi:RNA polymerase sigma factor (sigma-70 family)
MSLDTPRMEQELVAQAAWVRALARSLVRDDAVAEDLAQDACLAALRQPSRRPESMRNWLAGVVKRLAWKHHRDGRGPRPAIENHEIAPVAGDPDLLERLERLELHGMLVEELRAIREPLRTTLLQRYFEGLSAAQIAERTGTPAPSVRWRLQQGLEELRTRLDARFGGKRDTWMSALAFALPAKWAVLGGSGIAIGEGVLMTTLMKVSIGAAVLAIAMLLARPFLTTDEGPEPPVLAKAEAAPLAQPEGEPKTELASGPDAQDPSRTALGSSERSTAADEVPEGPRVVARIVDEQRRPIANAWLCRDERKGELAPVDAGKLARAGAEGIATLPWRDELPRYGTRFIVGAEGYATVFRDGAVEKGKGLDLGDVVLHPGGSVRGRVVDAEQHPIAGAEVVIDDDHAGGGERDVELLRNRGPSAWTERLGCLSAADGSFLVAGVPAGSTRAWAKSGNLRWAVSAPLEVPAGGMVSDVLLVVESSGSSDPELADIEGVVLGPDGKPIAKPCLYASCEGRFGSWSYRVIGGEDGHFRVQPHSRGGTIKLDVSDAGSLYPHAIVADVKPGTKDLEVRLEEAKTLVIVATDEHGPVERFRVRWGEEGWANSSIFLDEDEPHADGRASVRVPSDSFWYHVSAPGHRSAKLGPVDGRSPPATLALSLSTIPGVRGRVLAGDRPVAGAELRLCEQPLVYRSVNDGFTTLVNVSSSVETKSAEDGSFTLDLQKDGRFSILVDAAGYARAQFGPVELLAAKGLSDVEIPLDAGGTLEGRVLMPPDHSPASVIVGINRGDGKPLRQTVGQDGSFRFEHLTAGTWELQRALRSGATSTASLDYGGTPETVVLRQDFTIAVGQTTHKDLDLRDALPSVLEIELQHNSSPARAWTIAAEPKGRYTSWGPQPNVTTDSNGHARLELQFAGECKLTISPPAESASGFERRAELTLKRGQNNWTEDVQTGRIEGTIADWKPGGEWEWQVKAEAELFAQELKPDAAGRFALPLVAAGKVAVLRAKAGESRLGRETVQAFELAAGETKVLQLP